MKVVPQKTTLNIENNIFEGKEEFKKHGILFPHTMRCIIVGPSNCGKTNVMINLLEHKNGLKFENIYVYSKSLYQPKYKYLEELIKPIKGMGYYAFSASDSIMHPSEAKPNPIFIFDDVACDIQEVIREYFSMSRHALVDPFYLNHSYAKIPKHLIRDNCNSLILFKMDDMNLRHVYADHVGSDMPFDEFKTMCSLCWKDPYGFLSIFKDCKV